MPLAPEVPDGVAELGFPTRIRFGPGAVRELPELLQAAGVKRPLIVTDRGLQGTDAFARLEAALKDVDTVLYAGVEPNPPASNAADGATAYREGGCDGLIGVGGGSSMDVAKVVRILATHGGDPLDYDYFVGGMNKITAEQPFLITVPTTAGTGSEVGRSSVLTDPATHVKRPIFSPHMMPPLVVADPELTLGLPARITADTGIDALTHAVEAYLTPAGYRPMCDAIALRAIGLVGGALRRAVDDGSDLAARSSMLIAALMAAVAFQKGLGATHALAHPLSTLAGVPHGRANGLLLPHLLRFNAEAVPERVREVGQALADDDDAAAAVEALSRDVGQPASLTEAGVDPGLLDALVEQALGEHLLAENPRPVGEADVRRLYQEAFGG